MNDNIERHKQLLVDIHEMFVFKNAMYGDSFALSLEKYGLIAGLTRMSDKFNRIENIILNSADDTQEGSDESLIDSLLDLANYSLMTVDFIQEQNNKYDD